MSRNPVLDPFDLKLLAALQADGRLGNQDLADKVHLSPSQCSRRRLRLEEAGVIRGYAAILAPELLGLGVTVYVKITLSTHNKINSQRFAQLVRSLDCIIEAHAVTGDGDYLLKLVVADLKALSAVVNDTLLPHGSIAQLHSMIILETLKAGATLPLSQAAG